MSVPFALPDLARARHARRALEQALDHGTALLAALGLPRLVGDGFVPIDPISLGDALDVVISHLDAIDAPEEDLEDDDPLEKIGDDEEALGWSANVSQLALGLNTADGDLTAPEHHGTGFVRCAPDDHEPNGDAEPSLGRPEGFQFETGGDFDLECVDEGDTDDGEDATRHSGRLLFLSRASHQSEVAHA